MFVQHCWTWLRNKAAMKARDLLLKILASGPIPKHVAFVMDGNRRYARLNHMAIQDGHSEGFVALRRVYYRTIVNYFTFLSNNSLLDAGSMHKS